MSVLRDIVRSTLILGLASFGVYSVSFASSSFGTQNQKPSPPQKIAVTETPPKNPFAPGTQNLSLGVGQVFLLGDLGNKYENAIGPEIHYNYGVSDLFAFESNFGYHSHSSGNLSIWNLAAGLRANLMYFDQLVPFANVGLGFYHPSYSLSNQSSLLFGLQMGGGIDLMLSNQLFFGTRLTYNDMFDSSKKDLGGSFISFMIHIGMTF